MLAIERREILNAFHQLMSIHRLARLCVQHPTYSGAYNTDLIERSALQGHVEIVSSQLLPEGELLRCREQLTGLGEFIDQADFVTQVDRYLELRMVQLDHINRPPEWFQFTDHAFWLRRFDPNIALMSVNQKYDEIRDILHSPDWASRNTALYNYRLRLSTTSDVSWPMLLLGEIVGSLYPATQQYTKLATGMHNVLGTEELALDRDRMKTRTILTDTAYGIAAYQARQGALPTELESLVPAYLDTVPLDLFSSKPLRYARTESGFLLYSVGPNILDDGGVRGFRGGDIVFGDRPE